MKTIFASLLVGTAATMSIASPAAAQQVDFSVAGDAFSVPVPEGYCVPRGNQAKEAETFASWDSQNVTPVTINRCNDYRRDYFLIKSPRGMPALEMSRPQFIAAMRSEFSSGALEDGLATGKSDIERGSGGAINVTVKDYGFVGTDDVCVYLAGTVQLTTGSGTGETRAASCMTLVGQRNLVVHVYDFNPEGASIDQLIARSRKIAASIKPK